MSSGSSKSLIFKFFIERMEISTRIEIEKFNGYNFELLKLKMDYLLVDQEQWVVVSSRTIFKGMSRA
jgi:hypothetical protein